MAEEWRPKERAPMGPEQLAKFRDGVFRLNDNELARQYRYLHDRLRLQEGVATPETRILQEFVQIWREAHRRGRITPLPKGVR